MSLSSPFIKRPIGTSLLMVALLLLGVALVPRLPLAPLPAVEFPTITVNANYPGASAETMASAVAAPLEYQLGQISGVTDITSTNVFGATTINVQFDLARNIDAAGLDVLEAINAAGGQLPKNLPSPPIFRKSNPTDAPIYIAGLSSETLPLTEVSDAAENQLAQQISQIPGVGLILVAGAQRPAIRVRVDPIKLAGIGLTLEDVRLAITNATVNAPKGNIDQTGATPEQGRQFTIQLNDQITEPAPFDNLIIAFRHGAPVRVRDIGHAERGPQNFQVMSWHGTKPAVLLVAFKQPGANIVQTVAAIHAAMPKLTAALPPTMHLRDIMDRTLTIRASLKDVATTLILSVLLVVAVIYLFLRSTSATVIPALAVPLSLLGTAAIMYPLGYSLDNLSLMGMTIAVGFVVDDAIVMLENIARHIEHGASPYEAAEKGAGEIGFTIISISISLIAVFIPFLLLEGLVGRIFREFAVVVSIAVGISAVVSLTLTPMLCARFLADERKKTHNRLLRISERGFAAMADFYRRTLDMALRHHRLTAASFIAVLALGAMLAVLIPKGFFPMEDIGIIMGLSETNQDASFEAMRARQEKLNAIIAADPAVDSFGAITGAGQNGQTMNNGRVFIGLKPWGQRPPVAEVVARLSAAAAKIEGIRLYMQPAQDITIGSRIARTQYQFTLQSGDAFALANFAPKMLEKLRAHKNLLRDVTSDQQSAGTTATLTIDREAAARLGVTVQQIDDTLYDAFGHRQVVQYFTQTNSYWVILEAEQKQAARLETLGLLTVRSASGALVPLSSLLTVSTVPVLPLALNRQAQLPAVTLSFNLAPGASLSTAVEAIKKDQASIVTPSTIHASFQGNAAAFEQSWESQKQLIIAALIAVYVVLGVLYESVMLPVVILSTLPSAGVGALIMLMAAGRELSIIAMIGIILLIGIVKKNGIMMVDFAIHAERERGLDPATAIRDAALARFRPIMMTTMAALLSGLPLMLGRGAGSELRQPLGYAIVGGLLLSQALTLYTTPIAYLYLHRLEKFLMAGKLPKLPRLAKVLK
jgi:hydrophobe/amphiphile efflux-1 (HAE1) family protein